MNEVRVVWSRSHHSLHCRSLWLRAKPNQAQTDRVGVVLPAVCAQAGRKQAVDQEVNAELNTTEGKVGCMEQIPATQKWGRKKWVTGYWATADIGRVPSTSLKTFGSVLDFFLILYCNTMSTFNILCYSYHARHH